MTRMVAYWAAKAGTPASDWEDGAAYSPASGWFAVTDGASTGGKSREWAYTLARAFIEDRPAEVFEDRAAFLTWVGSVRTRFEPDSDEFPASRAPDWVRSASAARGSHATFVGGRVEPHQVTAIAAGDCCLFHLGVNRRPASFPITAVDGFGTAPLLISSNDDNDRALAEGLRRYQAKIAPDDVLLASSDALAQWMLTTRDDGVWDLLSEIGQPGFLQMCRDLREAGQMKNDDVTLWRATSIGAGAIT
jgi:hypothetical protein